MVNPTRQQVRTVETVAEKSRRAPGGLTATLHAQTCCRGGKHKACHTGVRCAAITEPPSVDRQPPSISSRSAKTTNLGGTFVKDSHTSDSRTPPEQVSDLSPKFVALANFLLSPPDTEALETKHFVYSSNQCTITRLAQCLARTHATAADAHPIAKQLFPDDFRWADPVAETGLRLIAPRALDHPDQLTFVVLQVQFVGVRARVFSVLVCYCPKNRKTEKSIDRLKNGVLKARKFEIANVKLHNANCLSFGQNCQGHFGI